MALNDSMIYTDEALDGYDVYLTLDKQVQIFLDNAVEELKNIIQSGFLLLLLMLVQVLLLLHRQVHLLILIY